MLVPLSGFVRFNFDPDAYFSCFQGLKGNGVLPGNTPLICKRVEDVIRNETLLQSRFVRCIPVPPILRIRYLSYDL